MEPTPLPSPAQLRDKAVRVLVETVDDDTAKPQDRRQAADSILKMLAEEGDGPAAKQTLHLTDDELLGIIVDARARRAAPEPSPVDKRETSPVDSLMARLAGLGDKDPLCA